MTIQRLRTIFLFAGLAMFLFIINLNIYKAEEHIKNSVPVYLELIPVDPRSLIQGDYMWLEYQLEQDAEADGLRYTHRGKIVIHLDENNVAHYDRPYTENEPLAENEMLINYHTRGGGETVFIGVDTFLFQEGLGKYYTQAKYAEIRVSDSGTVMLVDLVGAAFEQLPPD